MSEAQIIALAALRNLAFGLLVAGWLWIGIVVVRTSAKGYGFIYETDSEAGWGAALWPFVLLAMLVTELGRVTRRRG
jgi:hypothetical protein